MPARAAFYMYKYLGIISIDRLTMRILLLLRMRITPREVCGGEGDATPRRVWIHCFSIFIRDLNANVCVVCASSASTSAAALLYLVLQLRAPLAGERAPQRRPALDASR